MDIEGSRGLSFNEDLIFHKNVRGVRGASLPESDVPIRNADEILPPHLLREELPEDFPEVSEVDIIRHFTRLSQWNFGVDNGFYPLGSCTMKYNPKINEKISHMEEFSEIHPYFPEDLCQGALEIMHAMEQFLAEISGMDSVTLQPSAGAHGELTGLMLIRAYHKSKGNLKTKIILPDSAHGTNPASSSLCGYSIVNIKSGDDGRIFLEALQNAMDDDVAALMITNPNTLGLFEKDILEISKIVHQKGGLMYCDGANMNAMLGICRPGDMGFDVIQFNLHKTFSTPHGGGGPGSGPVGVKKNLSPYLPVPVIESKDGMFSLNYDRPESIGKVRAFYGNFGIILRAYCYILTMGAQGLRNASEVAIINANYMLNKLKDYYHVPFGGPCKHEFVINDSIQNRHGIKTLDIAKRLMDYGFHPPTIYFPLITKGAMMIEPTETESKRELDSFIDAMIRIARECEENPEILHNAPEKTRLSRLDETKAARNPVVRFEKA